MAAFPTGKAAFFVGIILEKTKFSAAAQKR